MRNEQLPVLSFSREGLRTFSEPLSLTYPYEQQQLGNQKNKAATDFCSLAVFIFFPVKIVIIKFYYRYSYLC